jgi:hypothetical protein
MPSNALARLVRELSWQGTARQYGLNWKSVPTIMKRAVQYGLNHRGRPATRNPCLYVIRQFPCTIAHGTITDSTARQPEFPVVLFRAAR